MRARREPVPPVGVDPDEDRLEEEGEALECEPEAKHVPEVLNPHRPQESQFKGQDRARHHADGEQCEHDPRPPARERPVELVPGPQVPPLREQHDHGERDTEAHQRDVHGQRQRLHLPRFEQVVLIHVHRCQPIPATTCRSRPGPGKTRRQRSSTQPCHFPVWRWPAQRHTGDGPATRPAMLPPVSGNRSRPRELEKDGGSLDTLWRVQRSAILHWTSAAGSVGLGCRHVGRWRAAAFPDIS